MTQRGRSVRKELSHLTDHQRPQQLNLRNYRPPWENGLARLTLPLPYDQGVDPKTVTLVMILYVYSLCSPNTHDLLIGVNRTSAQRSFFPCTTSIEALRSVEQFSFSVPAMSGLTSPSNRRDAFAMVGLQLLMLALSAAFGRYDPQADAKTPLKDADKQTISNYYPSVRFSRSRVALSRWCCYLSSDHLFSPFTSRLLVLDTVVWRIS
uniref:Uncharacterized protein n=1 Tax=Timema tahoe TaxID=61484 RepID=A0A7R9IHS6_9NEOP|nr:unnamed protein product [Timema tahoe]